MRGIDEMSERELRESLDIVEDAINTLPTVDRVSILTLALAGAISHGPSPEHRAVMCKTMTDLLPKLIEQEVAEHEGREASAKN